MTLKIAQDAARPGPAHPGDLRAAHNCVLRHVSRTARAVSAAYDAGLAGEGLTGNQFNVLTTLDRMGPLTVGALAEALGMDASTVPRIVSPLISAELIASETGVDRRKRFLKITRPGNNKLKTASRMWLAVQERIATDFGPQNWIGMTRELKRLAEAAQRAKPCG